MLLGVGAAFDLSDTTGADEGRPAARGERVVYVARGLSFQPSGDEPPGDEEQAAPAPSTSPSTSASVRPAIATASARPARSAATTQPSSGPGGIHAASPY